MFFKPTLKSVRDGNVGEMHYLTETEIREKEGAWDNIDLILKNAVRGDGNEENKTEQSTDPLALYEI